MTLRGRPEEPLMHMMVECKREAKTQQAAVNAIVGTLQVLAACSFLLPFVEPIIKRGQFRLIIPVVMDRIYLIEIV